MALTAQQMLITNKFGQSNIPTWRQHINAHGGDGVIPSYHHGLFGIHLDSYLDVLLWDDVRGVGGYGPSLGQPTGGAQSNHPSYNPATGLLTFNTSNQEMTTQTTGPTFYSAVGGLTLVIVGYAIDSRDQPAQVPFASTGLSIYAAAGGNYQNGIANATSSVAWGPTVRVILADIDTTTGNGMQVPNHAKGTNSNLGSTEGQYLGIGNFAGNTGIYTVYTIARRFTTSDVSIALAFGEAMWGAVAA